MELMNVRNFEAIAVEAQKRNIEKIDWFNFCSYVSDVWFDGDLTWEQMTQIKDWAWDVKDHVLASTVFGVLVYAHKNNMIQY